LYRTAILLRSGNKYL